MGERKTQVLRSLTGQGQDLGDLLGGELGLHSAPMTVLEDNDNEFLQLFVARLFALGFGEPLAGRLPSKSPPSDSLLVDTQAIGLRRRGQTFTRQQDDPRPNRQLLRSRLSAHKPFENLNLTSTYVQTLCGMNHATP